MSGQERNPPPSSTIGMRYRLNQRARSEVRRIHVDYRQRNRSFSWSVEQDFDLQPHLLRLNFTFTAH